MAMNSEEHHGVPSDTVHDMMDTVRDVDKPADVIDAVAPASFSGNTTAKADDDSTTGELSGL